MAGESSLFISDSLITVRVQCDSSTVAKFVDPSGLNSKAINSASSRLGIFVALLMRQIQLRIAPKAALIAIGLIAETENVYGGQLFRKTSCFISIA